MAFEQSSDALSPHSPPKRQTRRRGRPAKADIDVRRNEVLDAAAAVIASSGLRASMQEIADIAGIQPGSLYHHFESKEKILVELMQRYHSEMDRIGTQALKGLDERDARPTSERILELGSAIAECAVRHSAAMQLSFYEAPAAHPELVEQVQRQPTAIQDAMVQTLRAGRWSGYIKPDVDVVTLADQFWQTMMLAGVDVIRHKAPPDEMAALLCRIMLDGLAVRPPDDEELDRSSALAVADDVIQTWTAETDGGADARTAHVRAVARREFGRRGYEITTVRDIAAATDLPTGTVYRLIGSKEELLESIMRSFTEKVDMGSVKVIQCEATSIQKLDALNWVRVNALDQFPDEFRIELAWMRQTPPGTANPAWSFQTRLQQMETLLSAGIRAGEIRDTGASTEMLARCVLGIRGIPDKTLHSEGKRAALIHIRDTILRGIATGAEPSG